MSKVVEVKVVDAEMFVRSANTNDKGMKAVGTVVVSIYPKKWQQKAN